MEELEGVEEEQEEGRQLEEDIILNLLEERKANGLLKVNNLELQWELPEEVVVETTGALEQAPCQPMKSMTIEQSVLTAEESSTIKQLKDTYHYVKKKQSKQPWKLGLLAETQM